MKRVLMITHDNFPNEDAGALRDMSFVKIYKELGYSVTCICNNNYEKSGNFDGVEYVSIYKKYNNFYEKAKAYVELYERFRSAFDDNIAKYGKPDVLHVVIGNNKIYQFLKRYKEQNKLVLIIALTEWYSPCEFKTGIFSRAFILNDFFNRFLIDNSAFVIAISSYMAKYFKHKGIRTCIIPVILDCKSNVKIEKVNVEKVNISYVGSPANKDYLGNIIKAYSKLTNEELDRIYFQIVGISEKEILKNGWITMQERMRVGDSMKVYGRLPHDSAENILKRSDFSLLVRNSNKRYAKAGFPTKSVEAMKNGVAMMCNLSSDLDRYLVDGENSIILEDETVESILRGFRRVIYMETDTFIGIRRNAKKRAIESFDYRKYIKKVKWFIQGTD